MTAFQKLIMFSEKLDGELCSEYQQLISDYMDERDRLQNERIATSQAITGTYEVVAIAGTAEQLLNDIINVGDTVIINPNVEISKNEMERLKADKIIVGEKYVVMQKHTFDRGASIGFAGTYWHSTHLFRKVSTPIVNPLNSVEGC